MRDGNSINATINGNKLMIKPGVDLAFGTEYMLQIPSDAVTDAAGNTLFVGKTSPFTTKG